MNDLDIQFDEITNGNFEGITYDINLPKSAKSQLSYEIDETNPKEVKLVGSFEVEFDDDMAMPILTGITVFENKNHFDLNLSDVDIYAIESRIVKNTDTYEWYVDHVTGQADALYDAWKDGTFDEQ
jgi:hypothetical protein